MPLGECYCVTSVTASVKQQVKEVLDHFNVRVTESDIFSRCQVSGGKYEGHNVYRS